MNIVVTIVAYSIFQINSECKFENIDYSNVNIEKMIYEYVAYFARTLVEAPLVKRILLPYLETIKKVLL